MPTFRVMAIAAFLLAACGGSSPTAPAPAVPAAHVVTDGDGLWTGCKPGDAACTFEATLKNLGPGCAAHVHGATRFSDGNGALLGTFDWTVDGMLAAQASVTYRIANVPYGLTDAPGVTYRTTPAWDDVRCP